jgi:hypothetical protein
MNKVLFTFICASFSLSGIQASYAMEKLENAPNTDLENVPNTPNEDYIIILNTPNSKRTRPPQNMNGLTQEEKNLFEKRARRKIEFDSESESDSSSDFD